MSALKFQENTPIELALRFGTGKHVKGQFGEQVMYSLKSGEVMYVPLIVEKKLQELNAKPGETLQITKAKTNGKVEWQVSRIAPRKPQAAAQLLNGAPSLDEVPEAAETTVRRQTETIPPLQLEHALKTALHAAKAAEQYSHEIGHPIQFDKDDVRLMAQTLVINASKERAA